MAKSRSDPITGLTDLELRFVFNYISSPNLNASKALKDSDYNGKNTDVNAAKMLKKPAIMTMIGRLGKKVHGEPERAALKAKKVVEELELIAFQDPADYLDDHGNAIDGKAIKTLGPERRSIASMKTRKRRFHDGSEETETEFKFQSKVHALDLLGRHYQLYSESAMPPDIIRPVMMLPDNGKSSGPMMTMEEYERQEKERREG
jgi:hypothetical protein